MITVILPLISLIGISNAQPTPQDWADLAASLTGLSHFYYYYDFIPNKPQFKAQLHHLEIQDLLQMIS